MSQDRAASILGPILRTNEFLGVGPFVRPVETKGHYKHSRRFMRYIRFASFMVKFWWFRGLGLFTMKYFFARSYFRAGVSDFGRNTVATVGLLLLSRKLTEVNQVIVLSDSFSHREESRKWVSRLVSRMNMLVWGYVSLRIFLDIATFYSENLMPVFMESEMFIDPAGVPPNMYPLILCYAFVDMMFNRLITSVALLLNQVTYIVFNFLAFTKFSNFDSDIRDCLRNRGGPNHIWRLRLLHADLCQLIIFMDDLFSPLALLLHGGVVAGYCTETLRFIQRYERGLDISESWLTFFTFALNMTYLLTMISITTASTSKLCESPKRSMRIVHDLLQNYGAGFANMTAGSQQIRLLLSQMQVKYVQMTAWRFYKLDRAALMTTLGASVTYVSVVVQSSTAD
ncbi:uncharacterized protein LOC108863962 [Galendromus occidentalis]|uniref:Uncharacterized protein LOC108863962 n=1 Tax=Galendromus occidentalis TaxID=34638 RepID=A0AAJ7P968_9ACAR|nr:uncharacterized protein LOC108863962 [Galendromus occidentalis]